MSTPDYYKYDDGEIHFECFDISRYYPGDWAQVIQYVFRWQKKGGVKDLEKALACAMDAYNHCILPDFIDDSHITQALIKSRLRTLKEHNFSNAARVWEAFMEKYDRTGKIIYALERLYKNIKNPNEDVLTTIRRTSQTDLNTPIIIYDKEEDEYIGVLPCLPCNIYYEGTFDSPSYTLEQWRKTVKKIAEAYKNVL